MLFSVRLLVAFACCLLAVNGQACNDPVYNRNYRWSTDAPINTSCINATEVSEIQALVSYVNDMEGNATIRGVGKSFSWSGVAMMETRNFYTNISQPVLFVNQSFRNNCTVDADAMQMTCEAGIKVIELCEELERHGLGLPDFGGPMVANFIGSFNSGTHGKGTRKNPIGNMARQVISFEMILANGSIITASESENSDIYQAGRITMGSLGIITKFTVQAVPFFNITRHANGDWRNVNHSLEHFDVIEDLVCNNLSNLIDNLDFIYGGYQVFREYFQWQEYDYETEENRQDSLCWNANQTGFNPFPCTDAYYRAISPVEIEAYQHGANNEAEFYVYEEDFEKAYLAGIYWVNSQQECNPCMWNKSQTWHENHAYSPGGGDIGEIQVNTRWIGPDCQWLSPAYSDMCENGTSIAQIGIYMPGGFVNPQNVSDDENRVPFDLWNFWVNGYYKAIKQAVSPNPVRVHWGKASQTDYCQINESYPKMEAFKELQAELDPYGIFVNQIVRDKLNVGCDGCCCATGFTCELDDYACDIDWDCGFRSDFSCESSTNGENNTTPEPSPVTTGDDSDSVGMVAINGIIKMFMGLILMATMVTL